MLADVSAIIGSLDNQATASLSMVQERERNRASASTISGNRWVRSLPGRLKRRWTGRGLLQSVDNQPRPDTGNGYGFICPD
jgi:hypothetical protein